jgi:polysaccharide biosynthesis/export protein
MKTVLVLLWSALAISSVPAAAQATREVLGPGDTVRISDFRYPELRTEIRLSEDGKANVPMIGQVRLSGMTPEEAAAHIADRLKSGNFILDPQVDVAVIEARSRQVAVLGFVKNPGRYKLDGTTAKLTDVIAMAGGPVSRTASAHWAIMTNTRPMAVSRSIVSTARYPRPAPLDSRE